MSKLIEYMKKTKQSFKSVHLAGALDDQFDRGTYKILLYCQRANKGLRTKKKLLRLGYSDIVIQNKIDLTIKLILQHSPKVIIISHTASVSHELIDYLILLREFSSVPVIIWGYGMPKGLENSLLNFDRVYSLSEGDGEAYLNDLLWRIRMKTFHPAHWM